MRVLWVNVIVGAVLAGTLAYALAEDLTLTTYYPSPRGVYKDVRITDRLAVGTTTPTAQVEVVAPAPITAVTTNQTTLAVSVPAATRFNTFDASLTNTAAAITNQAINSSGSNQLTNVGLSVAASGAERNYGLLVPEGQVGIGTATPHTQAALDVVGKIRIADGTQQNNRVLTSDTNGLASWQAPSGTGSGWRRIASYSGQPFGSAVYVVTDDLPAACTADNSHCEGIMKGGGNTALASFDYLNTGGGAWQSIWYRTNYSAGGENTTTSGGNTGVNGDGQGLTIVYLLIDPIVARTCELRDDANGIETSASKFVLVVNASGAASVTCEVWVSGF